jgi:hypothetical protein
MDAEEREQSRIIDELADLDAPALLSHAQDLVDAMKFEYKSGNEDDFWLYQNKLVALGRVVYAKHNR